MTPLSIVLLLWAFDFARSSPPQASEACGPAASRQWPAARSSHAMTYHSGLGQVLLVGGALDTAGDGFSGWDGRKWTGFPAVEGPGGRRHFALAYDQQRSVLLLHGGFDLASAGAQPDQYGDMWAWSGDGWRRVSDEGPGPRDHHAMIFDEIAGATSMFGGGRGQLGEQMMLGDTWRRRFLDPDRDGRSSTPLDPSARV